MSEGRKEKELMCETVKNMVLVISAPLPYSSPVLPPCS